jgi:signal peptidase II
MKLKIVGITATIVFLIEVIIKSYLRLNLAFQSIPLIKNIFHITVVFNKGAAFGILQGKNSFLIYVGFVFISIFFVILYKEKSADLLLFVSYGLILGGALSNLFDRIFLGYVVDYIDLRIWPVFNLSDSCINIGIITIFLKSLWKKH